MTCDEEHFRWRNFQSAIARITVLGLVECRFLCSLENIIPGGRQYAPSKTTEIACDLFAGVQWILLHGEYVYAECKKRDKVTDPVRQMWSMELGSVEAAVSANCFRGDSQVRYGYQTAGGAGASADDSV